MNPFKILVFIFAFGVASAQAADIGGVTANGEIAFDYGFLSSRNHSAVPFSGSATNEAYRLNQAQLVLKKETEQIAFLGRLVYNQIETVNANGVPAANNMGSLDQVEVFYKLNPQWQIGFGRFLTTMGYESLLKYENVMYGNTIAYQAIIPGFGEGLRAKYVHSEALTATVSTYNRAAYNKWSDDYTATKATEVSATGMLGNLTWFGGYYFGKDATDDNTGTVQRTSGDAWVSYKMGENSTAAVTYDTMTTNENDAGTNWSDSTSAIVSYGWYNHVVGVRYEMIRGAMHLTNYGTADVVTALTGMYRVSLTDNLRAYVEYRMDHADQDVFVDADNAATADANHLTLGALAYF